jgi:hypothetical protein
MKKSQFTENRLPLPLRQAAETIVPNLHKVFGERISDRSGGQYHLDYQRHTDRHLARPPIPIVSASVYRFQLRRYQREMFYKTRPESATDMRPD